MDTPHRRAAGGARVGRLRLRHCGDGPGGCAARHRGRPTRQRGSGRHPAGQLRPGRRGDGGAVGAPHRSLASAPHSDADPCLSDCVPTDFSDGAEFRGAGRRPVAVRVDARSDVVGNRADRRAARTRDPHWSRDHRHLRRNDAGARRRQSADGGDERAVGLAAGRRRRHHRGGGGLGRGVGHATARWC